MWFGKTHRGVRKSLIEAKGSGRVERRGLRKKILLFARR
jgi:hypothetical protein